MKTRFVNLVAVLIAGFVALPAMADEGWQMPNLNPFANKSGPPTSGGGGWKLPRLWPMSRRRAPFSRPGRPRCKKCEPGRAMPGTRPPTS